MKPQNFSGTRRKYFPVGSAAAFTAADGPGKTLRSTFVRPRINNKVICHSSTKNSIRYEGYGYA
jgi:hypothetical protein